MKYSRKESREMWLDMLDQEQAKADNAHVIYPYHILKGMLSWVAVAVCVPIISLIINKIFPELNNPDQLHTMKWVAAIMILLVAIDVVRTIIRSLFSRRNS